MATPTQKFFVSDDGKKKLTLGLTELQAEINAGKHSRESLAWTEGMDEWLPLGDTFWEKHGIRFKGDSDNSLQPGSTFGNHRIVRLLGRGGMGEVYEVTDEAGTSWALKVLSVDMMDKPGAVERFRREALVMSEMDHPGIVKVDRTGESDGRHWLRMEMAEGREVAGKRAITLQDYMEASEGRLSETETKKLLQSLLTSLEYAHGRGLVHRDLKPANVLFFGDEPKIADFGLVDAAGAEWMETQVKNSMVASMMEETLLDSDTGSTGSRSRALMGTFAYMSPEQKEGREADARSDLYAIGLMAREAITGVKSLGMERPTEMADGIHPGWDDWVRQAVANDAERRFQSAGAMRTGLTFPKEKKSGSRTPLIALGLVAVAVAFYFVIGNPFAENPNAGEKETSRGQGETEVKEVLPDKQKPEDNLIGLDPGESGLRIAIDPPEAPAEIWLAGQAEGAVTDGKKSIDELLPGNEELIVKAPGYQDYSVLLRLKEGWNSHRVGLVALRGGLIVRSDPGVKVVVLGPNGREFDLGVTDRFGTIVSEGILAVGTYEVRLSKPLRIPVSRKIRLMEGKAVTLDEPLVSVPGKLSVGASQADVMVHLDGVFKGVAPLEIDPVPTEVDIELTARLKGCRDLIKIVRLKADGHQSIQFGSLVKESGSLVVKVRADIAGDSATKVFLEDMDVTAKAKRDSTGSFALQKLSVGSRIIKVSHPDYHPWSETILVRDEETASVVSELFPMDAKVQVQVRSEKPLGRLLTDCTLRIDGRKIQGTEGLYKLPSEKNIEIEFSAKGHVSTQFKRRFSANSKNFLNVELKVVSDPIKASNLSAFGSKDVEKSALAQILPEQILDSRGQKVSRDILAGKIIGFYFSAHWCPPCRTFTPKLVKFRNENSKDFEVVFVSSDRSPAAQMAYMMETGMKWYTLPHRSIEANALAKKFEIRGIPALIIVSPNGETITKNGRGEINDNSGGVIKDWLSHNHNTFGGAQAKQPQEKSLKDVINGIDSLLDDIEEGN